VGRGGKSVLRKSNRSRRVRGSKVDRLKEGEGLVKGGGKIVS